MKFFSLIIIFFLSLGCIRSDVEILLNEKLDSPNTNSPNNSETITSLKRSMAGKTYFSLIIGNTLYQAKGLFGLDLYDITSPLAPAKIDLHLDGSFFELKTSGNYLYAVTKSDKLTIYDISEASAPELGTTITGFTKINFIEVSGSNLFIADDDKMHIYDITTENAPTLVSTYTASGEISLLNILGSYAYIKDAGQIQPIDISDLSNPTATGTPLSLSYSTYRSIVHNNFIIYNITPFAGMSLLGFINLSAPSAPSSAGVVGFANFSMLHQVVVYNDTLYVASEEYEDILTGAPRDPDIRGIHLVDVSSFPSLSLKGFYYSDASVYGLAVKDDYLYAQGAMNGISIYDTNSVDLYPTLESTYYGGTSANSIRDFVARGNYLYAAATSGFRIFNISNPATSVSLTRSVGTGGDTRSLELGINHAYVVDTSSIRIIDISSPASASSIATISGSYTKAISNSTDTRLYIQSASDLIIYNIETKTSPSLVNTVTNLNPTNCTIPVNDNLYITDNKHLYHLDVTSDEMNPVQTTLISDLFVETCIRSEFYNNKVYFMTDTQIIILDVTIPSAPVEIGRYSDRRKINYSFSVVDDDNFILGSFGYYEAVDTSDLSNIRPYWQDRGFVGAHYGSASSGSFIYLSDFANVKAVDFSKKPVMPVASTITLSNILSIDVDENYIYYADQLYGYGAIKWSGENIPKVISQYKNDSQIDTVVLKNSYIYFSEGGFDGHNNGFKVIDATDPYNLNLYTSFDSINGSGCYNLLPYQDYVLCGYGSGIENVDITDPLNPIWPNTGNNGGGSGKFVIDGSILYQANSFSGIGIYDYTDPENIINLGTYDSSGQARDIVPYQDSYLYIADFNSGLTIVDITDKTNPTLIINIPVGTYITQVKIHQDHLYLNDKDGGIYIFNLLDPANPVLLHTIERIGFQNDFKFFENYLFIADGGNGILIYDITDPANPEILK